MKNLKFVLGFSVFGFILSFFFGLFSRAGFFHIIFFAFIFALVFAALGLGLQVLFDKVLEMGSSDDSLSQTPGQAASYQGATGQNVNIVIEDEDIPQEEEDSQFFVGTNHQMLNDSDYDGGEKKTLDDGMSSEARAVDTASKPLFKATPLGETIPLAGLNTGFPEGSGSDGAGGSASGSGAGVGGAGAGGAGTFGSPSGAGSSASGATSAGASSSGAAMREKIAAENSSSSGFVPVSLGETPTNVSGTEARPLNEEKTSASAQNVDDSSVSSGSGSDELDVLPDMEDITSGGPKKLSESEDDISSDEEGFTPSGSSKDASEITEGKDVALMAKAISTLLTRDK